MELHKEKELRASVVSNLSETTASKDVPFDERMMGIRPKFLLVEGKTHENVRTLTCCLCLASIREATLVFSSGACVSLLPPPLDRL